MTDRWVSLMVAVAACAGCHDRSIPDGLRRAPLFTLVYGTGTLLMTIVTVIDPRSSTMPGSQVVLSAAPATRSASLAIAIRGHGREPRVELVAVVALMFVVGEQEARP